MKRKILSVLLTLMLALSFSLVPALPAMAGDPEAPVDLGSAGNFAILAKTAVSTVPASVITGDVGVSPAATSFLTGFSLTMVGTPIVSATSTQVIGSLYGADMTGGSTSSNLTTAVGDMETAYTDAAGRTLPDETELGAGNIDGMTLAPGLYKWGTGVLIPIGVTLDGSADAVWIFQIAGNLTVGNAAIVTLSGGAQAKNIFWQVAGEVTLGTTSVFNGNILCQTLIAMNTGATLNGRALAQSAVTLIANTITMPAANTLTAVTATPSNNVAGATANYTIAFTTATALTVAGTPDRIVITFPGGFDASDALVDGDTITPSTTLPTLEDATTTVVTLDVAADETAGDFTIVLSGIVNTQTAGTAYVVAVKTQDGPAFATLDGPTVSAAFSITAAAVATLTVEVQPTTAVAGVAITPSVQVKAVDAFGNVKASQNITASLKVGTGALSGTKTQVTDTSGIATFNDLKINLVGTTKVLRFTAAAITVDSNTFAITVAVATLTVEVQPSAAVAGETIASVQVMAVDASSNVIAGQSIVASLQVGTGELSGTKTQVTDALGIATFDDLKISLAGAGKKLRFTAAPTKFVDSGLFNIYDKLLTLNTNGWTLISTDNYILSTSAFEGSVTLKYKYVAPGFLSATIADLAPVEAIYVKTTGADGLVGLNYSTAGAPGASTKNLVAGWNLVSSATETDAGTVLSPLRYATIGTTQGVGLATLVSQGSYNLNTDDWYIDATEWTNLTDEDYTMNPFDGYWVYMNAAKSFGVIPN